MNKARDLFEETPKRYNCAQAVAKAFDNDTLVTNCADKGGGRANAGICGALYAITQILPSDKVEKAMEEFAKRCGSVNCKDIRQAKKISCAECVEIAYDIAKEI